MTNAVLERLLTAGAVRREIDGEDVLYLYDVGSWIVQWYCDTAPLAELAYDLHDWQEYDRIVRSAEDIRIVVSTDELINTVPPKKEWAVTAIQEWLNEATADGDAWKSSDGKEAFYVNFCGSEDGDFMELLRLPDHKSTGFVVMGDPYDCPPEDAAPDADEISFNELKKRTIQACAIYGIAADRLDF